MMKKSLLKKMTRAEAGDAQAQHEIAISYAIGDGVKADLQKARYWYSRAADQHDPHAKFNLGAMCLHGEGGVRSKREAIRIFREASEEGSSDATIWLAETALQAIKFNDACRLFSLALVQGDIRGLRGIGRILERCDESSVKKLSEIILKELEK